MDEVLGVDFSGASDAGTSIWLAEGKLTDGELEITALYSAGSQWGKSRNEAHQGLVDEISNGDWDVVGFDFPFGLPEPIVQEDCWSNFVDNIDQYLGAEASGNDPQRFRGCCRDAAGGEDLRRATDEAREAQCPYGVRIMYQTYYGISNVLAEVIEKDDIGIPPQVTAGDASTTVVEVYPAATVRTVFGGESAGYKGPSQEARERRRDVIHDLPDGEIPVRFGRADEIDGPRLHALCSDDALDSVLAAASAARALQSDFEDSGGAGTEIEGHIFV